MKITAIEIYNQLRLFSTKLKIFLTGRILGDCYHFLCLGEESSHIFCVNRYTIYK